MAKGFGTALKPAAEFWILARRPLDGTVAANVLKHGTGALNIDAARVGNDTARGDRYNGKAPGGGNAHVYARKEQVIPWETPAGRFPANLVLSHTAWEETHCPCGAVLSFVARFCPECGSGDVEHRRAGCCAVGERRVTTSQTSSFSSALGFNGGGKGVTQYDYADPDGLETVTAWECLATCACGLSTLAPSGGSPPRCRCGQAMTWACAVARLDEQSGELTSGAIVAGRPNGSHAAFGQDLSRVASRDVPADAGGASRFFNTFAPPDDIEPFFYPCIEAKPCSTETGAQCPISYSKSHANSADPTSNQRRDDNGSAMASAPPSGQCGNAANRNQSRSLARSAKLSRPDTVATALFGSAPSDAPTKPSGESGPGARCAASPSEKCETSSALRSAATDLGHCPGSLRGMVSTTERKPRTLSLDHASDAARPGNTGTTPTIQSPSRSSGSAFFAIDESIISENRAGLGYVEPFLYSPKPSAAETEAGCEALPLKSAAENVDREPDSPGTQSHRAGAGRLTGRRNHHPTRKSIALMRHLCRLVTPPGGIVLDMFAGSGTTIAAASVEGFRAVGIEQEAEFVAIGRARATYWARLAGTRAVGAGAGKPRPSRDKADETGQGRLW